MVLNEQGVRVRRITLGAAMIHPAVSTALSRWTAVIGDSKCRLLVGSLFREYIVV